MANKIQLKKSNVTGRIPNPADLDWGEIALNYLDGKLFYKQHGTGTVEVLNIDTNTVTRLRGTASGTYTSGDITLLAGSNVSIAQSGTDFTISASGDGGGGSGLTAWSKKTANYTAVVGDRLIADTTASAFTITLPASPSVGQEVTIADGYDWRINNLIVARNGSTIEGLTDDVTLDIGGLVTTFIYDGSTWEIYISHGSGGGTITNDTSTNADTFYPTLAPSQTTGIFSQVKVSSSKLYYNPSSGQLNATNFNSLSDESAKCNIQTINNALATVEKMRGVTFDWIDNGEPGTGVLAGETEQAFSRIVSTNKTGKKSVAYGNAVGLLVEAIKELSAEVKLLKGVS